MAGADLYQVAGAKIYIGSAAMATQIDDFVESDFNGVSWTQIDGWETMGAVGDTAQIITTSLINRGRDVKQKGTRNAGSMQNQFAVLPTDAGQIALLAAEATRNNYPFKIEFDDAADGPSSPAPQPSRRYFVGLVTSAQETGGGANTSRMFSCTIEVNSNVVSVAANP